MHSQTNITVRGIIYQDGKLFLQKLKNQSGVNDFWCTPGGKLDVGEDIESGLRREMVEETGIEPSIGKLLFIQQFTDKAEVEWLEFFFQIDNPEDYHNICLDQTTHGEEEVSECGFVDPKSVKVLPEDISKIDLGDYVNTIQPVYIMNYLKSNN